MVDLITELHPLIPMAFFASLSMYWMWRRRQTRLDTLRASRIDPVGEAEVFLAYGRSKDALRVLQNALNREPGNLKIKVVMLRALAEQQDAQRFVHLAGEVRSALYDQPVWRQICKTGERLLPGHPLFQLA